MQVTTLDMRRSPKTILEAIDRGETVTLTHRGKAVAEIKPVRKKTRPRAADHEAVGMWADREDMADPAAWVRNLRKGRFDDL